VSLSGLYVVQTQLDKFGTPKSTPEEDGEHCMISPLPHRCSVVTVQQIRTLF
jgi:hypothetical protein